MVIGTGLLRKVNSLSARLVIGILVSQALLLPALYFTVLRVVSDGLRDQFVNEVRSTAALITGLTASQLPNSDDTPLLNLLDESLLGGRVLYAQIEFPHGRVLNSDFQQTGPELTFIEDFEFGGHGDGIYYIASTLRSGDNDRQVSLRLGFDESVTQDQINQSYRQALWLTTGYMISSIILVLIVGRRVTRPLQVLRAASRRIRRGQVHAPLAVQNAVSEVQDLADDLNDMRSELVNQATALEHQAYHDALTGLPNRALLEDRSAQAIVRAKRTDGLVTMLLLDLDRFKEVNDTLGHQAGDELLRQASTRMNRVIRESDTFARLGGDEFAVLMEGADPDRAVHIARSIMRTMSEPFSIENQQLNLGASVGIAHFPFHASDGSELLRMADVAMYAAKQSGSGYQVYDQELDRHNRDEIVLINDLREGLERNELISHFQPKVDLSSGCVCGVESLVRWQHPRKGLLTPDRFLHLSERSGLISILTERVIKYSAHSGLDWCLEHKDFRIAINLSAHDLRDEQLLDRVTNLLANAEFQPEHLQLELTETAVLQDPEMANQILKQFKAMGIHIVIDDFGTGFSSLVHLKYLSLDEIKIDKSFVMDMVEDSDDQAIVRAIIQMAHELDLLVTAEGVETRECVEMLQDMGCDRIQGYYLTRPLPAEDFSNWLQNFNGLPRPSGVRNILKNLKNSI